MNKQILKKIKSESGASIALAILVFLICALVGATILTAATASSGTLTNTWENDENVYLLKSAESMFAPAFENQTWQSTGYTKKDNKITDVPTSASVFPAATSSLYKAMCIETYNNGSSTETLQFELGATSLIKTPTQPIQAVITMDDSYNVTAVFSKSDTSRKLSVYIPASTAEGTSTQTKGTDVSWQQAIITIQ